MAEGDPCECPARTLLCNATDCQQDWAVQQRADARRTPLDWLVGIIAAFIGWRR